MWTLKLVFWLVMPCNLIDKYQHFSRTYCFCLKVGSMFFWNVDVLGYSLFCKGEGFSAWAEKSNWRPSEGESRMLCRCYRILLMCYISHVMLAGAGHTDLCNVLLIIYLRYVGRTYCRSTSQLDNWIEQCVRSAALGLVDQSEGSYIVPVPCQCCQQCRRRLAIRGQ
jgi:hypothetical protein